MRRVLTAIAVTLVSLALLPGCKSPSLSVDDTVMIDGSPSPIRVCAQRHGLWNLGRRIAGVEVAVSADGREIARGRTDAAGYYEALLQLPAGAEHFEAHALMGGQPLHAAGRVFQWPERTIVVVDIDNTICRTDIDGLYEFADRDVRSQPLPDAVETFALLGERFNILYLTLRQRELLDKSRRWLSEHGFPAGPVFTADTLAHFIRQRTYKREAIRSAQRAMPHVLIGIGNRKADSDAYRQCGMLSIVLAGRDPAADPTDALVFRDWKAIAAFFDANRQTLEDPLRLQRALAQPSVSAALDRTASITMGGS